MEAATTTVASQEASAGNTAPDLGAFVRQLAADLGRQRQLDLPGFPDVVVRIHRTLADERANGRDVVRLINAEPALAARLLQVANSAAFHPTDKPVTELRTAVTSLGFNVVRSVATSFAVRQLEQQAWLKGIRPQLAEVWRASTGVAAVAAVGSLRLGHVRADEALTAGLFHQLGTLYILTRAHKAGVAMGSESAWASEIADWHPTIARAILESWGMPEHIAESVERQDALLHEDDGKLPPLTRMVAAAKAYHLTVVNPRLPERAAIEARLRALHYGPQDLMEVLQQAAPQIARLRHMLS